jgi:RNA polymerase sigma-70 factor (ECF subfamily)
MTPVLSASGLAGSGRLPDDLNRLYRAAWAICGSPHDADDLVQETFARVLARPRPLRREDPLPYLMGALRKTHASSLRSASRRPQGNGLPTDGSADIQSSLGRPEVALEQHEVLDAIAALPREFRHALVAVDILGLTYGEASRALEVREATIATRLFRARQRLARTLGDEPEGGREFEPGRIEASTASLG